jgi:glycosyltransferase involved in cell wall biosynthesis
MISVVIPALNEQLRIVATVESLLKAARQAGDVALDVIIVDDGSTDRTGALADQLATGDSRIRVIHQPTNVGIGACFGAALDIAKYGKFMIVPGDNDIPSEMITRMMKHHDRADIVLSYFLNKEARGRRRNILSTLYNMIYMVCFDVFIQYVNGPAIYPTEILRGLGLKARRFSIVSEATIKTLRCGNTFCEISGYMQVGLEGSTTISLRNLIEVTGNFFRLFYEVHVSRRNKFASRPRRMKID